MISSFLRFNSSITATMLSCKQNLLNKLNNLKVSELQRIASNSGLPSSSKTKSDLAAMLSTSMSLANTPKQQILSIDLGFKNFAYALFRPSPSSTMDISSKITNNNITTYDLIQWRKVAIDLNKQYNPITWTNQIKTFIDDILKLSEREKFETTILIERQSTRGAIFSHMPITILSLLRLEATLHALLKDEDVRLMDPSKIYSFFYKEDSSMKKNNSLMSSSPPVLRKKSTMQAKNSKEKKDLATKYALSIITKPIENTPNNEQHIRIQQLHIKNFIKTSKKDDLADSFLQGKAHIDWSINLRKEYELLMLKE